MENPLRKVQHAYQEGKSAETALAEVVTEIEKGIKSGYALTVLLGIAHEYKIFYLSEKFEPISKWTWFFDFRLFFNILANRVISIRGA